MKWSGWQEYSFEARAADLTPLGERSGLHLSDVIKRMKIAAGESVSAVPGDQEDVRTGFGFMFEVAAEYMAAGLPLEESIELAFKRHMISLDRGHRQQLHLERDGIKMTPDSFDPTRGELISYKATWRSLAKARTQELFEEHFWPWILQESCYAHALGVDTATWVVLWVCGDYRGARNPRVMQATATWTADELAAQWAVILTHAAALREKS